MGRIKLRQAVRIAYGTPTNNFAATAKNRSGVSSRRIASISVSAPETTALRV